MATIRKSLSTKADLTGNSQILFRVNISRAARFRIKSGVFVPRARWDNGTDEIKLPRADSSERVDLIAKRDKLDHLEKLLFRLAEIIPAKDLSSEYIDEVLPLVADTDPKLLTPEMIDDRVDRSRNPEKYIQEKPRTFFDLMGDYLKTAKISYQRMKSYFVLINTLKRYELFVRLTDRNRRAFRLEAETMVKDDITDFESYIRNEHTLFDEYPKAFTRIIPAKNAGRDMTDIEKAKETDRRRPKARGRNTVSSMIRRLRIFFNWLNEEGITDNRPFEGYKGKSESYGTPWYLTLNERNQIADFDLSGRPELAVQRDIFIFQCLIGCRVSDLMKLTPANLINGFIEYIPRKTKEERPLVVRVPLNERAKALVSKYKGADTAGRLFPFISSQKYNDDIKDIFKAAGVTRMVTVIDPVTGDEVQRPINEIASSHLARRTFVGNLYKQVKDPNLICPLSGHVEGSKAFARYRSIDDDTKIELVKLID